MQPRCVYLVAGPPRPFAPTFPEPCPQHPAQIGRDPKAFCCWGTCGNLRKSNKNQAIQISKHQQTLVTYPSAASREHTAATSCAGPETFIQTACSMQVLSYVSRKHNQAQVADLNMLTNLCSCMAPIYANQLIYANLMNDLH